jgi:hypothetical protein
MDKCSQSWILPRAQQCLCSGSVDILSCVGEPVASYSRYIVIVVVVGGGWNNGKEQVLQTKQQICFAAIYSVHFIGSCFSS